MKAVRSGGLPYPYGISLSCVSHLQMDCNRLLTAIFGCLLVTARGELLLEAMVQYVYTS